MSPIIEGFIILRDLQTSYLNEDSKIYNIGASDEEIIEAELAFGASFPKEIKDFYKYVNGHKIYPDYFGSPRLIQGKYSLLSLKNAIKYYQDIDWQEYEDIYELHCFPGNKLFPILDGGNFDVYWIDLNQESTNKNQIYQTNTLSEPHCYAFLSLENMIETFKIAYEEKIIFKSDEIIKTKYQEFYQLCYEQTRLEIWK